MQKRLKYSADVLPFKATRPFLGLRDFSLTFSIQRPTCNTRLRMAFGPSDILVPGAANNVTAPRTIHSAT